MTYIELILQTVRENNITRVSFDVFDTLVFRHVHCPKTLFEQVLLDSAGLDGITGADYRLIREQAEKLARKKFSEREDIRFEDIFTCLPFDGATQKALFACELTAEQRFSLVNEDLVGVIKALTHQGTEVVLISDMYLSAAQIKQTFFSQYPLIQALPLYVSSEFGVTKHSGNLFNVLAKNNQWLYSGWLHIGDNIIADVNVPRSLGLQVLHYHPGLDTELIREAERKQFASPGHSSAVRLLAALSEAPEQNDVRLAFDSGAFIWGPVMNAFAEWAIQQSEMTGCKHILCLMREGYLFTPLIQQRLAVCGRDDITVSAFYVSRKSAFWPGIDTSQSQWLENVMDTLMMYRGYTLQNFIRDFHLSDALLTQLDGQLELKNIEGLFVEGEPLYQRLCREARQSRAKLEQKIAHQKQLLKRYLQQETPVSFDRCAVVDFGNGGTIQHSLETIFGTRAGANLLFYSSLRIYRFVDKTLYRAFISPGTETFRLAEFLARSPECLEALLLGSEGSTLGYRDCNGITVPVLANGIEANKEICDGFLKGCLAYINIAAKYVQPVITQSAAQSIVARYVIMPTKAEASLFRHLLHQDNFGTDGEYPVIDQAQIDKVKEYGLARTWAEVHNSTRWELGTIHWPAAIIALLDDGFIPRACGLMENDNWYHVKALVAKLVSLGWKRVAVYGAGEFFLEMLPHLQANGIQIEALVDRKAEAGEVMTVAGYPVLPLSDALGKGAKRFIISSVAFRDEIAQRIATTAGALGRKDIQMIGV